MSRVHVIEIIKRGPPGPPGDMSPEEWQQWQDRFAELEDVVLSRPKVPGLFAHWDAQKIRAVDSSRVGAWTDEVGGVEAVQATGNNQPLYVANGINGKPSLYFDTERNDRLVATVAPESNTVTVFVVMQGEPFGTGSRYVFGTNGHAKNVFQSATGAINQQGTSTVFSGLGSFNRPLIFGGVWNGEASFARVNGIQGVTGGIGTQTTPPTQFSIGNRTSAASANAFTGLVGEVLYYDRVLTVDEIATVDTWLAAKWGVDISEQHVWYVDSVNGSDTGDGRSADAAMTSIRAAVSAITASGIDDATVVVHAPVDTPIREPFAVVINSGTTIRFVSQTPGQPWYLHGSTRFTGGWSAEGSGVYSRSLALSFTNASCWVPTLLDAEGQPTRIFARNTSTPATPAEGEYGYDSDTYYLHLPGGANPNAHTVEVAVVNRLIDVRNDSVVTMQDGQFRGAQSTVIGAGTSAGETEGAGTVLAIDCDARFGQNGFGTIQYARDMTCIRCKAYYNSNDGFSHHGITDVNSPLMTLEACEGAWNDDEGVSPHESTHLILIVGSYHHNGHGGLTAVQTAEVQLSGTEFYANRRLDETLIGADIGGVSMLNATTLTSTNLYSHDHPGPGIEIAATATWIDNGGTRSGVEHDNGAPDSIG